MRIYQTRTYVKNKEIRKILILLEWKSNKINKKVDKSRNMYVYFCDPKDPFIRISYLGRGGGSTSRVGGRVPGGGVKLLYPNCQNQVTTG